MTNAATINDAAINAALKTTAEMNWTKY